MSDPTPTPPGRVEDVGMRLGTLGQLLRLFGRGKRPWLLPLVLLLSVLGLVLAGLQAVQYVAPFIYPLL
ncbi:MAG: hypothetical protein H6742_13815 [Alphaproteobacteria bacterium]|nr:hypothetical protein [Alphaproteobacteria bacterium]